MASTSADVKPPPEDLVLATLAASTESLPQDELERVTRLPPDQLGEAINSLLKHGRISIMATDTKIAFQIAEDTQVLKQERLKGLAKDELLIYQLISQAGDKGIWTKDMKTKSNLPHTRLPKILKALEARNLIKSVKGVSGGNRKIYMLFELQPSDDLTGGTWYTENHLDENFVESMRTVCRQYISRENDVTLEDIATFIREKGFSTVDLNDGDVQKIVTTLIYDGEIDEITDADDVRRYIPNLLRVPDVTPLSEIPCGHCPVMNECREGGDIAPSTCKYLSDWLDF